MMSNFLRNTIARYTKNAVFNFGGGHFLPFVIYSIHGRGENTYDLWNGAASQMRSLNLSQLQPTSHQNRFLGQVFSQLAG